MIKEKPSKRIWSTTLAFLVSLACKTSSPEPATASTAHISSRFVRRKRLGSLSATFPVLLADSTVS